MTREEFEALALRFVETCEPLVRAFVIRVCLSVAPKMTKNVSEGPLFIMAFAQTLEEEAHLLREQARRTDELLHAAGSKDDVAFLLGKGDWAAVERSVDEKAEQAERQLRDLL